MSLDNLKITWLGHATFLIDTPENQRLLIDPWLAGNPKCPDSFHSVTSDAILVTHGHADHIGDLFSAANTCRGSIVGIFDLVTWLGQKSMDESKLLGMNKGGTVKVGDLEVRATMVDARHSSSFVDEAGHIVYLGEAAGYVLHFSTGESVYVAGDTSLFGDMALIRELYQPTTALLPIGDHFTMDPLQAAHACRLLGVETVIPCHFGTFPLLHGTPAQLEKALAHLDIGTKVVTLEPGASTS